ncbi:MAG: serine hydrolase domain-containing protein [Pseudomonadota bacterium]
MAKGDRIVLHRGYGPVTPGGTARHRAGQRWRLASITKQVTAALAMQDVAKGRLTLDTPVEFVGNSAWSVTPRQLLTHHSGLANPDATPAANAGGVPGFYTRPMPEIAYCTSLPSKAAAFSYNNCDYVLLGVAIDRLAAPLARRWPAGFAMAQRGERGVPGFVGGKPEPAFELASWGAAGGLIGTARSVFAFDRALMTGKFLSATARAELWKPEGGGSYQALGQWVFPGKLKGCAAPKRIVQRDGEIYGVQARNFIFPDDDLVVIVFTNRGSDDFKLGEVWEGQGFTYDLLSAAACP